MDIANGDRKKTTTIVIYISQKSKKLHKDSPIVYYISIMDTAQDSSTPAPVPEQQVRLVDVEITNENVALNVMVSFLNIAQKRGAFNLDEAAKVWECVQKFIIVNPDQANGTLPTVSEETPADVSA